MSYKSDKERIEDEIRIIKKVYFWGFLLGGIGVAQVIIIGLILPEDLASRIFKIELTILGYILLACLVYFVALIAIGLYRKSKR